MTYAEKDELPRIALSKQSFRQLSKKPEDPSPRIYKYLREDLRKRELGERTDRTWRFIDDLNTLAASCGGWAPYAFFTEDGKYLSLDAGCLGFLLNRDKPEIAVRKDRDGFITKVRPKAALRRRIAPPTHGAGREFSMADVCERGQAPLMAFLILTVRSGDERVTYAQVAAHLAGSLRLQNLNHHHVGKIVEAMMDHVATVDPSAPLLNIMVMRRDSRQPGEGADRFLRGRFGVRGAMGAELRRDLVRTALNEIRAYSAWDALYERAYGRVLPEQPRGLDQFDDDGQPDNPRYRSRLGGLESDEHKRLKRYVRDNPHILGMGLVDPRCRVETGLHSGDRLDVEIIDGERWIAVEVKSRRSGEDDLRRGVYQCVKYKAVMTAQSGETIEAQCDAVLVTETPLPTSVLATARRLKITHRVVRVPD